MPYANDTRSARALTPEAVRDAMFPAVEVGGLDPVAINLFLADASVQMASDREEIRTLRRRAEEDRGSGLDVSAETVNLLSRAQVIADKHVSEAEQYAHDLIDGARKQYSEILQKAEDNAGSAGSAAAPAVPGYGEPVPEIEYVRTYTRVAQVQLRSVIDALAEQVDQLGHLPQFGATASEPGAGGGS
ncbi:MAG: hypothetical protein L0J68_08460 [Micrococcaceae bacterium]|uniref:hypothetical protein n=1 Tax=Arthrobacter sp. 179 TaxID=3457734 RepID=UPI0026564F7C|nr:hypothetical protein [Micrococcaceae bacterium]MDN5812187.1 hypothetical protein [Micrococcaceae bacterium]MDN5824614.1 hypothetical protein [Micrococcaceae bacterium]MDN5879121.1 hypothetical protein [Micrococcaceae bacterium]MDN5887366.1 hypothetical protein [Micrococcaceae bacterium]